MTSRFETWFPAPDEDGVWRMREIGKPESETIVEARVDCQLRWYYFGVECVDDMADRVPREWQPVETSRERASAALRAQVIRDWYKRRAEEARAERDQYCVALAERDAEIARLRALLTGSEVGRAE